MKNNDIISFIEKLLNNYSENGKQEVSKFLENLKQPNKNLNKQDSLLKEFSNIAESFFNSNSKEKQDSAPTTELKSNPNEKPNFANYSDLSSNKKFNNIIKKENYHIIEKTNETFIYVPILENSKVKINFFKNDIILKITTSRILDNNEEIHFNSEIIIPINNANNYILDEIKCIKSEKELTITIPKFLENFKINVEKNNEQQQDLRLCNEVILSDDKEECKLKNSNDEIIDFLSLQQDHIIYHFLLPSTKKEEVEVFLERDPINNDILFLVVEAPDFIEKIKSKSKLFSGERKKKKISLNKADFIFNNIEISLNEGILNVMLKFKNGEQNKNNIDFIEQFHSDVKKIKIY